VSECREHVRKHGKLSAGQVFLSCSGSLPCKAVIHTVGPMWQGGSNNEDIELKLAVEAALVEAARTRHRAVSLPAISCGVYGFPTARAAQVRRHFVRRSL